MNILNGAGHRQFFSAIFPFIRVGKSGNRRHNVCISVLQFSSFESPSWDAMRLSLSLSLRCTCAQQHAAFHFEEGELSAEDAFPLFHRLQRTFCQ